MLGEFATPKIAVPSAWLLAGVFLIAAYSKFRNPASTAVAVREFGIDRFVGTRGASTVAYALAPTEVVAATLLIVRPRIGAVVAFVLLCAFTLLVLRAVLGKRAVRCGCFGGSDSRPVGFDSVVRNAALLSLCVLVISGPSSIAVPSLAASLVVGGCAIGVALVISLLRLRADVGTVFAQDLTSFLAGSGTHGHEGGHA